MPVEKRLPRPADVLGEIQTGQEKFVWAKSAVVSHLAALLTGTPAVGMVMLPGH